MGVIVKRITQVDFSDIFYFAEEKYGIGWNPANDVFFGNAFEYNRITDFYASDWAGYVTLEDDYKKASDVPLDVVTSLGNYEKSWIITAAYMESQNITGDIQINGG